MRKLRFIFTDSDLLYAPWCLQAADLIEEMLVEKDLRANLTMDTDRELLEAAAKAAGIKGQWMAEPPDGLSEDPYFNFVVATGYIWNPLTDDGDALRLAVKLGLTINPYKRGIFVSRDEDEPVITEEWADDDYAATRRAIVRAAAEIGRNMK